MTKITRVIFPNMEKICTEGEIYFRVASGVAKNEGEQLFLESKTVVSFDAFFNCVPYGKLLKYTNVRDVRFNITVKGHVKVRVLYNESIDPEFRDKDDVTLKLKAPVLLKEVEINTSGEVREEGLTVEITNLPGQGILYAEIESFIDSTVYEAEYVTSQKPERKSKIGLVFFTFKREEYVKGNVKRLRKRFKEDKYLGESFGIFVVDNGNTLKGDDVEGALLFPNPNTGGSGGFTRGMLEVQARPEYTHFLLMDDDLIFETEILAKILFWTEMSVNASRITIGAAMLFLDRPYMQHELGCLHPSYKTRSLHAGYDLRDRNDILFNEYEQKADYTGWWCCCMPIETIDRIGKPLQFFIKIDDVEYSVRAENEIILTNGIGVWHENFDDKYSSELEYYIIRNGCIYHMIHEKKKTRMAIMKRLVARFAKELVQYRYEIIDMVIDGFKDFLKGADFFTTLDNEKKHMEVRSKAMKQYTKEELKSLGYDIGVKEWYQPKKDAGLCNAVTLNGYFIPKCFYSKGEKNSFRLVNMNNKNLNYYYKANVMVQYNPVTEKGFLTKINKGKVFSYGFKLAGLLIQFLFKFRKLFKGYRGLIKDGEEDRDG